MSKGRIAELAALALVLATVLVACGGDDNGGGDDLLGAIEAEKTLTVSTDPAYPPQSKLNEKTGKYEGFDIDVATEIAERLGAEVAWEAPAWDTIIAGNWNGRWDISVGSMTITPERAEVLHFTPPYYYTPAAFAVHEDNSTITDTSGLAGKKIGVCGGCTYDLYLQNKLELAQDESGEAEKVASAVSDPKIRTYDTDSTAIQDLEIGRIDAAMSAVPTLQGAIDKGRDIQLLGDPVFYEPLAAALDKSSSLDSSSLTDEIAAIIEEMHTDGTLTQLSEKWYGEDLTQNPTG
jgi:polar amino acid transport system substrate-binding protein